MCTSLTPRHWRQAAEILGGLAGSTLSISERRSWFIEQVASLVGADLRAWVTNQGVAKRTPAPVQIVDGGFRDEQQRAAFWRNSTDPRIVELFVCGADHAKPWLRYWNCADPRTDAERALRPFARELGLDHVVITYFPLVGGAASMCGFHRKIGTPAYAPHEIELIELLLLSVESLHRAETDIPANDDSVEKLSPRLREMLVYLVEGQSRKQIARTMQLSEHTIADYLKQIHKHFNVNSRAELLAKFIVRGRK